MSRRLAATLTLSAAAALAACGSSTEPEVAKLDEPRTYVLRQVAGHELPVVLTNAPWSSIGILADTLHLRVDGTGSQVTQVSVASRGEEAREERWETSFRYELRGDRFELSFVCPPDEISSCIAPPHYRGRFMDGALRVDHTLGLPAPLLYVPAAGG